MLAAIDGFRLCVSFRPSSFYLLRPTVNAHVLIDVLTFQQVAKLFHVLNHVLFMEGHLCQFGFCCSVENVGMSPKVPLRTPVGWFSLVMPFLASPAYRTRETPGLRPRLGLRFMSLGPDTPKAEAAGESGCWGGREANYKEVGVIWLLLLLLFFWFGEGGFVCQTCRCHCSSLFLGEGWGVWGLGESGKALCKIWGLNPGRFENAISRLECSPKQMRLTVHK